MVPAAWVDAGDPVTVGIADDSSSRAALEFACREALVTSTSVRLVHAWLMPTPSAQGAVALVIDPESELSRHRALLDDAVQQVLEAHPRLSVQGELVRDSRSAALLKFSTSSSMLVIGTHHHGPVAGALFGSVAQEILWRAECPVCIVPDDAEEEGLT